MGESPGVTTPLSGGPAHLVRRTPGAGRYSSLPPERASRTPRAGGPDRGGGASLRTFRGHLAADDVHGATGAGTRVTPAGVGLSAAGARREAELAAVSGRHAGGDAG